MSLYQKYRPKNLAEIVGQDHIKQTLQNATQFDRVGHAYLFSGPHGVGKTSIARILARGVNCTGEGDKPCNNCINCTASLEGSDLNIIEIDAASNRGIDDIRSLKEKVAFPPQGAKRKVYIIDEVHMLSKDAFNALLKTLEEPPKHSLFILATTELHKVLDTIISRTQHFELKKITDEQIVVHLKNVAKSEDLELSDDAGQLIAMNASGSLRDSLSLLDQLKNYNQKIDLDAVRFVVGIPAQQEILDLVSASLAKNHAKVLTLTDGFVGKGYDVGNVIDSLVELLRGLIYLKTNADQKIALPDNFLKEIEKFSLDDVMRIVNNLIIAKAQMRWVALQIVPLQLALLGGAPVAVASEAVGAPVDLTKKQEVLPVEVKPEAELKTKPTTEVEPEKEVVKEVVITESAPKVESAPEENIEIAPQEAKPALSEESTEQLVTQAVKINWEDFVKKIREENMKLSSLLVIAKFAIIGQTLEISVPFNFYVDRIDETESKTLIKKVYRQMTGLDIEPKAVLGANQEAVSVPEQIIPPQNNTPPEQDFSPPPDDLQAPPISQLGAENKTIETIKEVFGELVH